MTERCRQWRRMSGQSARRCGSAQGSRQASASSQRQKLSWMGAMAWAMPQATTKLPAQTTVAARAANRPVREGDMVRLLAGNYLSEPILPNLVDSAR